MTLHDRIMAMTPDSLLTGKERGGFYRGRSDAAKLATEADELMAEMAQTLEELRDYDRNDKSAALSAHKSILESLHSYNTYKERNNEQ